MAGRVSPGIYTNELTFNDYAQQLSITIPAIVGGATKGPMNVPTVVSSEPDLIAKFAQPTSDDYGLLAAVEFLKHGTNLLYLRVGDGTETSSSSTLQGAVGAAAAQAASGSISFPSSVQPENGDTVTIPDRALPATGSITLLAQPQDTDNIVLDDGTNPAVTFEFDNDSSVVQTSTLRQVVIGASVAATLTNLYNAIRNAPTLAITPTLASPAITLQNDASGTAGNVAITKTDPLGSVTVTGMSGGAASSNVITYEFDAAVAATGNVDFTGLPLDGETVVIEDGVNPAITYEFDGDASVVESATLQQVVIGADAAATALNLLNKINTPTAGAVIGITASAGAGDSVDLVNDVPGTAGNIAIIETATNLTATGMSGGLATGTVTGSNVAVSIGADADATALNLQNAINAQEAAGNSAITAEVDDASTDPLVRVYQVAEAGADGNLTITQAGGGVGVAGFTGGTNAAAGTPSNSVTFAAKTPGTWGDSVRVEVVFPSGVLGAGATSYDIVVSAPVDNAGVIQVVERFENVNNTTGDPRFVESVLTDGIRGEVNASQFISASVLGTQAPYAGTYVLGTSGTNVSATTAGTNGITGLTGADYVGTTSGAAPTGLKTLRDAEQTEFNLLVVPGVSDAAVHTEMFSVVDFRGDSMAIIDPPFGVTRDEVIAWHNGNGFAIPNAPLTQYDNDHSALFWPWFQVYSEYTEANYWSPPSVGFLEAAARTDEEVGPWVAAAGFQRGVIEDAIAVEVNARQEDRDLLLGNLNRVNPIPQFASSGVTVYGNRTLLRASGPLDSIHVLRMLLYAKKLIVTAIQYLQFQPNDPVTWRNFTQTVNPILQSIAAERGLLSFSVKCDAETNPPALRAQKTMRGIIFLEHVDAAEIIEVDFALKATGEANFSA